MENLRQITLETYNRSARDLSEYFKGVGPRIEDIKLAFEMAGNPKNPQVVEIGCGDGRDAREILKLTDNYLGFDISESFIELARQNNPGARLEVADAVNFKFPSNTDIVFAFASLLHLDKDEIKQVCKNVSQSLKPGGVFYISTKAAPQYSHGTKEDDFGIREFYFYNDELLVDLAGEDFEVGKMWHKTIGDTDWLELALIKKENHE